MTPFYPTTYMINTGTMTILLSVFTAYVGKKYNKKKILSEKDECTRTNRRIINHPKRKE